jgi:hypothetical protein
MIQELSASGLQISVIMSKSQQVLGENSEVFMPHLSEKTLDFKFLLLVIFQEKIMQVVKKALDLAVHDILVG